MLHLILDYNKPKLDKLDIFLLICLCLQEDCIVICVDWEAGATLPNYVRAAANTRLIGKQLAFLMKNLQVHKGLDLGRVHVIGFSLGAHVSGFAGSELPGLRRITGLFQLDFIFGLHVIKFLMAQTQTR